MFSMFFLLHKNATCTSSSVQSAFSASVYSEKETKYREKQSVGIETQNMKVNQFLEFVFTELNKSDRLTSSKNSHSKGFISVFKRDFFPTENFSLY